MINEKAIAESTTKNIDIFKDELNDIISDAFFRLQSDFDIKNGDISPLAELSIENAKQTLIDAVMNGFLNQIAMHYYK